MAINMDRVSNQTTALQLISNLTLFKENIEIP
jgi:hypothetical protein